ncbi:uncharacterized mitochondrial protein-like protein, partial [Tanacetum coccineum]
FGSTKKSLCVEFESLMHKKFQMSSIGEITFYLGLQVMQRNDGIFISQHKYMADILKKFDFVTMKTASTLIKTKKALLKDVDVHLYKLMIGSLMYLTTFRPDIMFAICACARFQVTPNVSHLHAVKRIFRYLKGQPKLGLWYPRDSPFDLEAFSDSDYARASLDRKSTTGDETVIKEWEDKMERAATTASSLEVEQDNVNAIRLNLPLLVLVYAARHTLIAVRHKLMLLGITCYYWTSAKAKIVNGERQIQTLVDKKKVIITKTSIRSDLKLDDAEGTYCLPTATIFVELERMSAKTTSWNEFSSTMAYAIICLATNKNFNFSKYIFDNMVKNLEGEKKSRRKQRKDSGPTEPIPDEAINEEHVATPFCDPPQNALEIESLKRRVKSLEKRRKSRTPGFKGLRKVGSASRVESSNDVSLGAQEDASKQGRKIVDLDADAEVTLVDETQEIDDDNLMLDTGVLEEHEQEVAKKEVSADDLVTIVGEVVTTANVEVTTANAPTTTIDELTLAQTLIEIKAAKPKAITSATTTTTTTRPKARVVVVQEPSEFKTTSSPLQASQLP